MNHPALLKTRLVAFLSLVALGAASFAAFTVTKRRIDRSQSQMPARGAHFRDFQVLDNGITQRPVRELLSRKRSIVLFVKPECGHCQVELTMLEKVELQKSHLNLLVIVEPASRPEETERFLREQGARFRIAIDQNNALFHEFGGMGVPAMLLVDEEGVIRTLVQGERDSEFIRTTLLRFEQND